MMCLLVATACGNYDGSKGSNLASKNEYVSPKNLSDLASDAATAEDVQSPEAEIDQIEAEIDDIIEEERRRQQQERIAALVQQGGTFEVEIAYIEDSEGRRRVRIRQ